MTRPGKLKQITKTPFGKPDSDLHEKGQSIILLCRDVCWLAFFFEEIRKALKMLNVNKIIRGLCRISRAGALWPRLWVFVETSPHGQPVNILRSVLISGPGLCAGNTSTRRGGQPFN